MPCRDYPDDYSMEYRDAKQKLDRVTDLLCSVCRVLGDDALLKLPIAGLPKWWEEHQEMDRRREKMEREAKEREKEARLKKLKKQKAIDSLTQEQRDALGL